MLVHATAVAIGAGAVLLRGPPGSGKSDLALRLIDAGARLVADDQCELRRQDDRILARAPQAIAGLIEVRGLGLIRVDAQLEGTVVLVADLVAAATIERLPEPRSAELLGLSVPLLAFAPFEASAVAKLRLAAREIASSRLPAILG